MIHLPTEQVFTQLIKCESTMLNTGDTMMKALSALTELYNPTKIKWNTDNYKLDRYHIRKGYNRVGDSTLCKMLFSLFILSIISSDVCFSQ